MCAQPELNIEEPQSLLAYLRNTRRIGPDETPSVEVLGGGVSNRTVRVERATGEAWVIKQALAKLRVPVDWFSSPARIHREALGLRWLAQLVPDGATPRLLFEDDERDLLAMQAVPRPHANWKTLLLAGELKLDYVDQFGRLLAAIHANAYARREEIAPIFDDRTFFESLRLEPYYGYTATQVSAAAGFLSALIEQTRARRITLVHGDYSPKNILVYQERLILLDHEVIHFGDPAFDLGFSLTHLLSKAHHLPALRLAFAGAAKRYWRVYAQNVPMMPWAQALAPHAVRHTLACLLARVAGRSPLEYMDGDERARQRTVVVALMAAPPRDIPELVDEFVERIDAACV